jgi:predicted transcriptional regulator
MIRVSFLGKNIPITAATIREQLGINKNYLKQLLKELKVTGYQIVREKAPLNMRGKIGGKYYAFTKLLPRLTIRESKYSVKVFSYALYAHRKRFIAGNTNFRIEGGLPVIFAQI